MVLAAGRSAENEAEACVPTCEAEAEVFLVSAGRNAVGLGLILRCPRTIEQFAPEDGRPVEDRVAGTACSLLGHKQPPANGGTKSRADEMVLCLALLAQP
mmetsp:Transcript_11992/g.36542  ORF Transcript_11992/g.36542 Transcript_11992/m.36542 type:complete len:100 (+) Transcript_11992:198-497(+)